MADNIKVWCLLIDDKKKATFGDASAVKVSPGATVSDLKEKLKDSEDFRDDLQHVSTTKLFVWRCRNPKLFSTMEGYKLQVNMNKVDYTNKTNVTRLGTGQVIKELRLSDSELLLIEVLVTPIEPSSKRRKIDEAPDKDGDHVELLTASEEFPHKRNMFLLYNFLWRKPENWGRIAEQVEERVPDPDAYDSIEPSHQTTLIGKVDSQVHPSVGELSPEFQEYVEISSSQSQVPQVPSDVPSAQFSPPTQELSSQSSERRIYEGTVSSEMSDEELKGRYGNFVQEKSRSSDPFQAVFVNLMKIEGWQQHAVRGLSMPSYFMIRQEYSEFDEFAERWPQHHISLLGQPGIGKTFYLTYCTLKRLHKGRRTILSLNPRQRYLFSDSGVYAIPGESFHQSSDMNIIGASEDTLVLYDLNSGQTNPAKQWWLGARCIVSSSPQHGNLKDWLKHNTVRIFYMRTWSWEEIYAARDIAFEKRHGTDDWRAAFANYGGSARNLLGRMSFEADLDIENAAKAFKNFDSLYPANRTAENSTSSSLAEVNPTVIRTKIVRCIPTVNITSLYVFEFLSRKRDKTYVDGLQQTFGSFIDTNMLYKSSATIAFKSSSHKVLFHRRAERTIAIRPLEGSTVSGNVQVNWVHVKDVKLFGQNDDDLLRSGHYYKPIVRNLAGIDSYVVELDESSKIVGLIMFQATISLHHPIKTRFIKKLWSEWSRSSSSMRNMVWKLVFVVPSAIQDIFEEQRWDPTSQETTWRRRVKQYVLGIPEQESWNAMRRDV